MKKVLSILLISAFAFQFTGFYVYFIFRLQEIRREMRAELRKKPAHELQLLKLTQSAFQKAKVGVDEIRVDGKMYDIAFTQDNRDGSVSVFCESDEAEDNLLSLLNEIFKNASKDKKPIPSGLNLLTLQAVVNQELTITSTFITLQKTETRYRAVASDFILSVIAPPPRA